MKWIADLKMQNKHRFCWPMQSVTQLLERLTGPSLSLSWPASGFQISHLSLASSWSRPSTTLLGIFSHFFFSALDFVSLATPTPKPLLSWPVLDPHCWKDVVPLSDTRVMLLFSRWLWGKSLHGLCVFLVELVLKNLPASAGDVRDTGAIPGLGRSPRRGHGSPLQYSCLENPMGGEAWRATVHESQRVRHN